MELPGIEPGSSDAEPSILRAQSASRFSQPRHLSGHHVPTGSVAVEVPQPPATGVLQQASLVRPVTGSEATPDRPFGYCLGSKSEVVAL